MKIPFVSPYQHYRKVFEPWSALYFPLVKRLGRTSPQAFRLTMASPQTVFLRPTSSDIATVREVFLKQEYAWAAARLSAAPLIVDVGANIGLASRFFLTQRPQARILAIEALPETFAVTQQNLGLPEIAQQCKVVNAAIWSTSDQVSMSLPAAGAFSRATVGSAGEISVRACRLETLLDEQQISEVDLLKVDIEGAEVEMFRDADAWLGKIRALAIEFHDNSREACDFDQEMARHGFQIHQASDHTVYASRK
jgi:FkbM family methyltransferase